MFRIKTEQAGDGFWAAWMEGTPFIAWDCKTKEEAVLDVKSQAFNDTSEHERAAFFGWNLPPGNLGCDTLPEYETRLIAA
jgi:hypothetical protein